MSVDITDEEVAMTILSGLPSRFEHLIVAIDTTKEDSLSVEYVKSRTLQEEQRLSERQSSATSGAPPALINNRNRGSVKFCIFCKMKNHTEPYCWKKYPEKRPKSSGQSLVSKGGMAAPQIMMDPIMIIMKAIQMRSVYTFRMIMPLLLTLDG